MDANGKLIVLGGSLALLLGGCEAMYSGPTARPEEQPPPPRERSEVVQAEPAQQPEPTDDVELAVQGYIERIDTVQERAQQPPGEAERHATRAVAYPESTRAGRQPPVETEPAADTPAPTTQPAEEPPAPPKLVTVTARAEPEAATPHEPTETASPGVNEAMRATHAPTNLTDFLDQWPGDEDQAPFRQQLDHRVLLVIAGEYDQAREPLSSVSDEQQQIAARMIESLIAIREEAHGGNPPAAANRVLAEWERLAAALQPLSELQIPTFALCQEVVGFGQYRLIDPPLFRAGVPSEFVAYCEVRNFVSELRDDGMYHTRFDMRTRVFNSAGDTVLDIRDNDIVDTCRQQRRDCFIPRLVRLPPTLSPGEYVAKATLVDKLGEKVAESRATFRLTTGR